MFCDLLGMFQQRGISESLGCPGSWDSLKPKLSSQTGPNEGASAAAASPAAHGVSDSLVVLFGCQDSMQRCLERTGQTSCVGKHSGD